MSRTVDPASAHSTLSMQIRFCETDLMGIVHHANYLIYAEAGRVDWLHKRGVAYDDWVKNGIHLPVVESRLRYKTPARFDDLLQVRTELVELKRVTVKYRYRMSVDGILACEVETTLACVGHDLKLCRIPEAIHDVFLLPET